MFRRYAVLADLMLIAIACAQAKQPGAASSKDLKITVVDVEGGAATLFLTPEGKSLLIDTGWPPGFVYPRPKPGEPPPAPTTSSADRIAAAAGRMGIKRIDYLEMTHYHGDHLGGLQSLLEKLPVDTFIDHGPTGNRHSRMPLDRTRCLLTRCMENGWRLPRAIATLRFSQDRRCRLAHCISNLSPATEKF
jgi:glyoxylase-like metal-dependent hydrolase (beta-lactamase superfamily II)